MSITVPNETHDHSLTIADSFESTLANQTGPLRYRLTNDYMFKCVCQDNKIVLRGFLASLLCLKPEEIVTVDILNPIEPGKHINEKTIILDMKVMLNDDRIINIEMQVANRFDWVDRALFYTCRTISEQLKPGQPYIELKPTYHVGILDFDLFDDFHEFHTHYIMTDPEYAHIFTGKIAIDVVNLNCIEKANQRDISSGLRDWAKLFRSKTWEDLKMAAQDNESMKNAVLTLKKLSAEEKIQLECEAREMYDHDMASIRYTVEKTMKEAQKVRDEIKTARVEIKTAREEAETAREEAETAREEAETAREEAETAREEAETAREEAETARQNLNRANQLTRLLAQQNRLDDIIRAADDPEYQVRLLAEFNL